MAKIAIDRDRMYDMHNSIDYFLESTNEFDSERKKLLEAIAKLDERCEKFQDDWATQMDKNFPGWRAHFVAQ